MPARGTMPVRAGGAGIDVVSEIDHDAFGIHAEGDGDLGIYGASAESAGNHAGLTSFASRGSGIPIPCLRRGGPNWCDSLPCTTQLLEPLSASVGPG